MPKLTAEVTGWDTHEDGHAEYIVEVSRAESGVLPRVSWQVQISIEHETRDDQVRLEDV